MIGREVYLFEMNYLITLVDKVTRLPISCKQFLCVDDALEFIQENGLICTTNKPTKI